MKFFITFLLLLFFALGGVAQNNSFSIKGKVASKTEEGLPFSSIQIDTVSLITASDIDGLYELKNIPEGTYTITASSFGFLPQTKQVSGRKNEIITVNFSLEEEIKDMEDVIITIESVKERMENSAQAVDVIDTKEAKLKTADMGDVLAATQGVSVRRSGGLGTSSRFSLNGLSGDQIRFFLDGVPLEYCGYTFGIANVPVNLVDRIEIYKGVVPIQFGADALGGAVNLVSSKLRYGLSGAASYQTGSFGTHRGALSINYLDDSTGLFVRGEGFYDYAKNNYKVDVEVPNEKGKLSPTTVSRFHDGYRGAGGNISFGVQNKIWAKELSIKGFYSDFSKEVQHNNLSMEGIPYGEVMTLRKSVGANLVYRQDFGEKIALNVVSGYNYSERQFIDTAHCVYNWYGECILVKNNPGESVGNIISGASHQYTWDRNFYTRLLGTWRVSKNHSLRFSSAPTYTYRTGKEEFTNTYDPAAAKGRMFNWVNGIEYELDAFSNKLENIFFAKNYVQNLSIEEPMPNKTESLLTERKVHYYGLGNGLRYKLTSQFSVKTSYEYATRLPRPDELFGDGQFIAKSLDLRPERSHNINLELAYRNKSGAKSKWSVQSNLFLRKINNLIFLSIGATDRDNVYKNLLEAVSAGGEITAAWLSPGDKLNVTFNTTYQKYYNNSRGGVFESFYGDRIPNMPYFFTNSSLSYAFKNIIRDNSQLSPFWNMRYVYRFYNSWESAGLKESKKMIPDQQIHNVGLTYRYMRNNLNWALTGEIQNVLNERVFDFYGVQKPGRAFYVKLIVQF